MQNELPVSTVSKKIPWYGWMAIIIIDGILLGALIMYLATTSPSEQGPITVTIPSGASVSSITTQLAEAKIVRSSTALYAILLSQYDPTEIKAGTFTFANVNAFAVAKQLTSEVPQVEQITLTFPEGFSAYELPTYIPNILSANNELDLDVPSVEGYLFPDTYFVPVTYGEEEIITLLQTTFTEKITPLTTAIENSPYSLEEVVILASIIEREANDAESMGMVAGILNNRIEIGMALQVDASVAYGLQKSGVDLTRADIETDGPYNTYTRPGLPIGPIANPGLAAITAVLEPIPSDYFYYITGNDGNFYYATTLAEHNRNIARYLR